MKITRTGIVVRVQYPQRGKPQVRVTTGPASSDDFWAKVLKTNPPSLGEKVVIVFDQAEKVWTVAK